MLRCAALECRHGRQYNEGRWRALVSAFPYNVPLGYVGLAGRGGRCEHGSNDQSSRQELDSGGGDSGRHFFRMRGNCRSPYPSRPGEGHHCGCNEEQSPTHELARSSFATPLPEAIRRAFHKPGALLKAHRGIDGILISRSCAELECRHILPKRCARPNCAGAGRPCRLPRPRCQPCRSVRRWFSAHASIVAAPSLPSSFWKLSMIWKSYLGSFR